MHFSLSFTLRSSWAQFDVNADFKVSLPGNDEGVQGVPVLVDGFFNIPVAVEGRFFAPFFRTGLYAFVTEYGCNFVYSRSCSCEIKWIVFN